MEKCVIWYFLSLKQYLKQKLYFLQLFLMIVILFLFQKIQLPGKDSFLVGVVHTESRIAKNLLWELNANDGLFQFCDYPDEKTLYKDILIGKLEGGFVFNEDFDPKIEANEQKGSILFYSPAFSEKTEVIKEVLYAALFDQLSESLLYRIDEETYGNKDVERRKRLGEVFHSYTKSDSLFRLEITKTGETPSAAAKDADTLFQQTIFPLQGTIGLLIHLILYLAYGRKWESGHQGLLKALFRSEQKLYLFISMLAASTLPAAGSLFFMWKSQNGGNMAKEAICMTIFVWMTSALIGVLGSFIHEYSSYLGFGVIFLLLNSFLCPVFIDLSSFIPAVSYLRMLLPLGWYLQ